ncbi:hypothetical protein J2128_002178 [Methanomicrobium sp. W14]|uniref:hypothetical protein n=1 Tax=Methanomicrobium sp. W14 TaxID=2817839 RepID=UPI001AEA4022|nr:hypothetical protein [Methanomicrobium sp. W14]MBP2134212.1 hypothetical protein [Methanomicrobium sp. W14]
MMNLYNFLTSALTQTAENYSSDHNAGIEITIVQGRKKIVSEILNGDISPDIVIL